MQSNLEFMHKPQAFINFMLPKLNILIELIKIHQELHYCGTTRVNCCTTILNCGTTKLKYGTTIKNCYTTFLNYGATKIVCGTTTTNCGATILFCGATVTKFSKDLVNLRM
jgi:hypothetical protein